MNIRMLILFCALTIVNVILQTIKSLCTVKCRTIVSAAVNAIAYGLYCYVIFYTTSEGISLLTKAIITAVANFGGVYIANFLFDKLFNKDIRWKVEISIPSHLREEFCRGLEHAGLEYYICGFYSRIEDAYRYGLDKQEWTSICVFCPNKNSSRILKEMMPKEAKYNISECVKRL